MQSPVIARLRVLSEPTDWQKIRDRLSEWFHIQPPVGGNERQLAGEEEDE